MKLSLGKIATVLFFCATGTAHAQPRDSTVYCRPPAAANESCKLRVVFKLESADTSLAAAFKYLVEFAAMQNRIEFAPVDSISKSYVSLRIRLSESGSWYSGESKVLGNWQVAKPCANPGFVGATKGYDLAFGAYLYVGVSKFLQCLRAHIPVQDSAESNAAIAFLQPRPDADVIQEVALKSLGQAAKLRAGGEPVVFWADSTTLTSTARRRLASAADVAEASATQLGCNRDERCAVPADGVRLLVIQTPRILKEGFATITIEELRGMKTPANVSWTDRMVHTMNVEKKDGVWRATTGTTTVR